MVSLRWTGKGHVGMLGDDGNALYFGTGVGYISFDT